MNLFNTVIDKKLYKQFPMGSDTSQMVITRIFNPFGEQSWYIMNSDPKDPAYLWGIADLGYGAETGSISREELKNYKNKTGLGFERDLTWKPKPAKEVLEYLRSGKKYNNGGVIQTFRKTKFPVLNLLLSRGFKLIKPDGKKGTTYFILEHPKGFDAEYDGLLKIVKISNSDNEQLFKGKKLTDLDEFLNVNKIKETLKMTNSSGKTIVLNEDKEYNEEFYPMLQDFDDDGVANSDDKSPLNNKKKGTVETVRFEDSLRKIIKHKADLDSVMYDALNDFEQESPTDAEIYARTKTPYSIIKKLVDVKMKELTDVIGITIAVSTYKQLRQLDTKIQKGGFGEVLEREDFYESGRKGYRAIHYLIEFEGEVVELQIKTKSQKTLHQASHELYKLDTLDMDKMEEIASLIHKRDDRKADVKEKQKIDAYFRQNGKSLKKNLKK